MCEPAVPNNISLRVLLASVVELLCERIQHRMAGKNTLDVPDGQSVSWQVDTGSTGFAQLFSLMKVCLSNAAVDR